MERTLKQAVILTTDQQGLKTRIQKACTRLTEPATTAAAATFFSDHKATGLALFLGLTVVAPLHAGAAFLAAHLTRITAEKTGALASGVTMQGLMVNGFFLALGIASCAQSPIQALLLSAVGAPAGVVASLAMRRLLQPWNLPAYVAPYLLVIWTLWYAGAYTPTLKMTLPAQPLSDGAGLKEMLLAAAHGFSQIFFLTDARLGLFVATVLVLAFRRSGALMVAAGVFAVATGFILKCEPWIAQSGVLAFPAVLAVAALRHAPSPASPAVCLAAVAAAPVLELAALRAGYFFGVPAFSASYLAVMWLTQLSRDSVVRFGSVAWSSNSRLK
jgi:urea transporter